LKLNRAALTFLRHFASSHAIAQPHHNLILSQYSQHPSSMAEISQPEGSAQQPLLPSNGEPTYGTADGTHGTDRTIPVSAREGTFKRNLGAIEAFAIVISIVIGSGVFTSPGSIDANVPSPGAALLIWLVGGVLAWTGASTLAELGTAIPGEGLSSQYSHNVSAHRPNRS
jgi:amino acid permease